MDSLAVQEYLQQAKILVGQKKYDGALSLLDKAENADKLNKEVYLTEGIAYANMSDYERAKESFQKVLKINKNEGVAYFHLGNIELLNGNKSAGLEYYNNAVAYGFDDAQLYFSMGLMYEEDNNDDLAIRNYSKAIQKDPMRADIRIRKVRLFIKNNHLQEALQALDELILSNPDVFEGYHIKFLVLTSLNRLDEAEQTIEKAMELFPSDTGFALDKASLLTSKKDWKGALAWLNKIESTMEVDDDSAHSIAMERARIYALQADMENTVSSLEKAKQVFSSMNPPRFDAEAVYLLMNCYLNMEQYERVISAAKELKSGKDDSYYVLAAYYYEPYALKKLGQTQEADKLFKDAVSFLRNASLQNPSSIDSYAFRIMCLKELKELEKALELADYLVMVREDLAESHTLRAAILTDLGREAEAKEERAKAVSIGGPMADLPANNQ